MVLSQSLSTITIIIIIREKYEEIKIFLQITGLTGLS